MACPSSPWNWSKALRCARSCSDRNGWPGPWCAIAHDVLSGLAAAHAAHVLHRDIKPGNILLTRAGAGTFARIGGLYTSAKVADFGIAKATDLEGLTGSSTMLGTPTYMAPDITESPQSDLYSLGCVVYEMLAGQPPFTGPSMQAVIGRHYRETPDWSRMPAEALPFLQALLAKEVSRRPLSAADARRLLEPNGVPGSASPATSWQPPRSTVPPGTPPGWNETEQPVPGFTAQERVADEAGPRQSRMPFVAFVAGAACLVAGGVGGLALWAGQDAGDDASAPSVLVAPGTFPVYQTPPGYTYLDFELGPFLYYGRTLEIGFRVTARCSGGAFAASWKPDIGDQRITLRSETTGATWQMRTATGIAVEDTLVPCNTSRTGTWIFHPLDLSHQFTFSYPSPAISVDVPPRSSALTPMGGPARGGSVQSEECLPLLNSPSEASPTIRCLAPGTAVQADGQRVETTRTWMRVTTSSGQAGWVDSTQVHWN